ncbi:MAG: SIS domain-containing protein [Clostridia bacterium]|nr:SIS domain-containing protein [Clostridia bacterium]
MQNIAAAHTDKNCVVIGISHSGASRDIVQAMQIAKQNGATTVAITNIDKSPIDKVSDVVLSTVSDETNYRILGLSSRIAQLAIVDTIYSYLVCHTADSNDEIAQTELALKPKKI